MNETKMIKKALDALDGRVEIVHDAHAYSNKVDVIGSIGGDFVHYRVYFKNGEVDFIGCK